MKSIFDFFDYKAYLNDIQAQRSSIQRGFRSRLAEILNCQNAYISQILNTHSHFSLEQTFKICSFLQLNEAETKYFINLVEYARAGTQELQDYFKTELNRLRDLNLDIKNRVSNAKYLSVEHKNIYYSSWLYPTVHILVTIPEFQSFAKIVKALKVDASVIQQITIFLISAELIIESDGLFKPGPTQIHLTKDSAHIRQHHSNWRISAIQALSNKNSNDVHYSTVSSLSFKDVEILKNKFVEMIQDYVETIQPSKEETLYNFNLDFYKILSDD